MKKLSIEQKAKAYDEAIARIGRYQTDENGFINGIKASNIFPELAESEDENADEKIRKALIKLVTNHASMDLFIEYDIHLDEALSWLEKQGKPTYNKELSELLREVICRFINDPDIPYSDREKVSMKVLPYIELLEKQGERKPVEEVNGDDYGIDSLWHAVRILENTLGKVEGYQSDDGILEHKCAITAVKELSEQKPVIIPKFRIGDEIIATNEEPLTITKIDTEGYWSNDLFICGFGDANWELVEQKPVIVPSDFKQYVENLLNLADGEGHGAPAKVEKVAAELLQLAYKQKQWKPSDEMLEALYRVIPENVMEKSENEILLDKLYQGLKYGRVLSEK